MTRLQEKRLKLVRQGYVNVERLDNPLSVVTAFQKRFSDVCQEYVIAIYLDNALQPIHYSTISQGSINCAVVQPADIFRVALVSGATYFLLLHNHVSGCVRPSKADINLTSRLIDAGELIGVKLLDHIIVGPNSYYSMKEKDEIKNPVLKNVTDINLLNFCADNYF